VVEGLFLGMLVLVLVSDFVVEYDILVWVRMWGYCVVDIYYMDDGILSFMVEFGLG